MRILGPLPCATTSAVIFAAASLPASCVIAPSSTSSTADSATCSPGAASSFSTSMTSPSATLYCLPPVLTMAYIGGSLLDLGWRGAHGARRTQTTTHLAMGRRPDYGTARQLAK